MGRAVQCANESVCGAQIIDNCIISSPPVLSACALLLQCSGLLESSNIFLIIVFSSSALVVFGVWLSVHAASLLAA